MFLVRQKRWATKLLQSQEYSWLRVDAFGYIVESRRCSLARLGWCSRAKSTLEVGRIDGKKDVLGQLGGISGEEPPEDERC